MSAQERQAEINLTFADTEAATSVFLSRLQKLQGQNRLYDVGVAAHEVELSMMRVAEEVDKTLASVYERFATTVGIKAESRAKENVTRAAFHRETLPAAIFAVYVQTGLADREFYDAVMNRVDADVQGPLGGVGERNYPVWNLFLAYAQTYRTTKDFTSTELLEVAAVHLVREIFGQLHRLPKVTHRLDILNRLDQIFTR